jgi:hypothetical protein
VHSTAQPEPPSFKIDFLVKGVKMSSGKGGSNAIAGNQIAYELFFKGNDHKFKKYREKLSRITLLK